MPGNAWHLFQGATGFDWIPVRHSSTRRLIGWPPKKPIKRPTGNNDQIPDNAPSLAEADEILARFAEPALV